MRTSAQGEEAKSALIELGKTRGESIEVHECLRADCADSITSRPTGCRDPAADTFFDDALQGAASKFSDPDIVIKKAMEAAEIASLRQAQTVARIAWKHATLRQPMEDDCEFGGKVAGGPVNHVLCRTHGHVLDTTSRMVIAHDAEEYRTLAAGIPTRGRGMKRQFRRRT